MPFLDKEEKFYDYHTSEVDGDEIFDLNKASNSDAQQILNIPSTALLRRRNAGTSPTDVTSNLGSRLPNAIQQSLLLDGAS